MHSLLLFGNGSDKQRVIDSLNQLFGEAQDDSARVYILVKLSHNYSSYDLKSSIQEAEKALDLAKKSKKANLIEYAMFNAGNAYFTQGMFGAATGYFYSYLDIQKGKDNKLGIAYALANIGAIRLKMKDYKVAKQSFLQALYLLEAIPESSSKFKFRSQIPNIFNNLGIVYQNLHQYDSSLYYYRKGLSQIGLISNKEYYRSSVLNNIGGLFLDIKKADSAFANLSKAMEIKRKINDLDGQAESYSQLAEYYVFVNQPAKTLEYMYASLNIAKKVGNIDLQSMVSEKLYTFYYKRNNTDSALYYFILYNQLKDTINNSETLKELTKLELTSQFNEKKKIEQLEQNRLNTIYLFTALSLILLLLVFILLYILTNNRNHRLNLEKSNMTLSAKNTILENKNLQIELETRNKELTTHVMSMIRKNELIGQIVEVLSASKLNLHEQNNDFINTIIKDLNSVQDESLWEEFEVRYQQVHNEFYDKLQEICSTLSTNERRLCAFLRLNMTTKDIASITGQTLRSIEVARTRLRKKLQLTNSETGLTEFLASL